MDLSTGKLVSRILDRNDADYEYRLKQVSKLRYREMICDYNNDSPSCGDDLDDYDKYCDHAVIIDESIDEVIGTYRFILPEHTTNLDNKFLTETEFNIDELKKDGRIVELGRACVDKRYRNGSAITLLWKAALKYAVNNNCDYMTGVASFHGTDPSIYDKCFEYIVSRYATDKNCYAINHPYAINIIEDVQKNDILDVVPPLIKGYIRIGGRLSKSAYIDYSFHSIDLLVIIDVHNMDPRYKAKFSN